MIKKTINKLLKLFWIISNLTKPMTMMINKRLFVLRDSPDLLVRWLSMQEYQKGDTDFNSLVFLAKEEVKTRKILKKNDKTN